MISERCRVLQKSQQAVVDDDADDVSEGGVADSILG